LKNVGIGNVRWSSPLCKFARVVGRHRYGGLAVVTLKREASEALHCFESGWVYLVGTDGYTMFALPIASGFADIGGFESLVFDASALRSDDTLEVRTDYEGKGFSVVVRSKRGERWPIPLAQKPGFPPKSSLLKLDSGIPETHLVGPLNPNLFVPMLDVMSAHLEKKEKRFELRAKDADSPVFVTLRSSEYRANGIIMPSKVPS
jgi:hypothetical protein